MTTDVNTRNWFGDVTIENIKEVASAIEKMLTGKRYTFVANNADWSNEMPQVRTSQRIEPDKATDKRGVNVWFDEKESPPRLAWMNVADTYGVWGFSTSSTEKPYVVFEGEHTIKIRYKNGFGDVSRWVIAVEKDSE